MRYVKTLGLAGLAVVAMLVVGVGGASGTVLTSPKGTTLGVGAEIKAEAEGKISFDHNAALLTIECQSSMMAGNVISAGTTTTTAVVSLKSLSLTECGNHTVEVKAPGTLEIHAPESGEATVTWTGAEITVLTHSILLGTRHCIYRTNETNVGAFRGSGVTGGTATIAASSASLTLETDSTCGTEEVDLTGTYKITTPDSLFSDPEVSASTSLTSPAGTKLGIGTEIKAESEGAVEWGGTIPISCSKSMLEAKISNAPTTITVSGNVSKLTFTECGNHTVEVIKPGTLEIHSGFLSSGTLTSTGAEITVLTHGVLLGTRHCIYVTSKTHIGRVTDSINTGATAKMDIGPAATPQSATDGTCGNDAKWGGVYKVTSPDYLDVD